MQFQKISTPSLKDLFVKELENKILSGELKVGDKLPSERELASSMQVSRAVVNAGIAELEQKGFCFDYEAKSALPPVEHFYTSEAIARCDLKINDEEVLH